MNEKVLPIYFFVLQPTFFCFVAHLITHSVKTNQTKYQTDKRYSISDCLWTRQTLCESASLSKNVLIICETFLWETDLMTARRSSDELKAGHPMSRSIRAAGNDGSAGTRDEREDMGLALLAHILLFHSSTCCSQQLLIPVSSH